MLRKTNIDWQISEKDKNSLVMTHKYLSKNISSKIGFLKSKINDGSDWEIWNGSSLYVNYGNEPIKDKGEANTDCRTHDF